MAKSGDSGFLNLTNWKVNRTLNFGAIGEYFATGLLEDPVDIKETWARKMKNDFSRQVLNERTSQKVNINDLIDQDISTVKNKADPENGECTSAEFWKAFVLYIVLTINP